MTESRKMILVGTCATCGSYGPLSSPLTGNEECYNRDIHGAPCGGKIVQCYESDDENDELRQQLNNLQLVINNLTVRNQWLERGKRLLNAWIIVGDEHMKIVSPITYEDCKQWQNSEPPLPIVTEVQP